jgi:hypothetical protein
MISKKAVGPLEGAAHKYKRAFLLIPSLLVPRFGPWPINKLEL